MTDLLKILNGEETQERLRNLSALTGVSFSVEMAGRKGAGSDAASFPIMVASSPSGYVLCARSAGMDRGRLNLFAKLVAGDLERAATAEFDLSNMAQEIAERYEEINFLYDISLKIGSVLDIKSVCRLIVERAGKILRAGRCSVMLLDAQGKYLQLVAGIGLPEGISAVRVQVGEGISGRVAATGKAMVCGGTEPLPGFALGSRELRDVRHFVSHPLLAPESEGGGPKVLGVLNFTRKFDGKMFTSSDLRLIESIAAHTATHIRNCRLIENQRRQQMLEGELRVAAAIQLGLLPEGPVVTKNLTIAGYCRPAYNVGGDYYDYWLVRQGVLGAVIADVAGHNIGAALVASSFRTTIRNQAALGRGVAATVKSVNEAMYDDLFKLDMFLSLFYLEYELESGWMHYCRAGHTKPLLLCGRNAEWLDTEGPLIGLSPQATFEAKSRALRAGETVVLYTDGLMEAGEQDGGRFGEDGIYETAQKNMGLPAEEIAVNLIDAACARLQGRRQTDDMADLILKHKA